MKMLNAVFVLISATIVLANIKMPLQLSVKSSGRSRRETVNKMVQDRDILSSCFLTFNQIELVLGTTYNDSHMGCMAKAAALYSKTTLALAEIPRQIHVQDIGAQIIACSNYNSTLGMLHCQTAVASNITEIAYDISKIAASFVTELKKQYRAIELEGKDCCSIADTEFRRHTAENRKYLRQCLEGLVSPNDYTIKPAVVEDESVQTDDEDESEQEVDEDETKQTVDEDEDSKEPIKVIESQGESAPHNADIQPQVNEDELESSSVENKNTSEPL